MTTACYAPVAIPAAKYMGLAHRTRVCVTRGCILCIKKCISWQHPTKAMIPAYRALDAAYSKTHGRCCCTYRHGPWECPFVCQLCSKHAHEPWFMRAVHKPRFILAFRISRTTGTADHGLCTRFGFVNHDLCLFQRALLSSAGLASPLG